MTLEIRRSALALVGVAVVLAGCGKMSTAQTCSPSQHREGLGCVCLPSEHQVGTDCALNCTPSQRQVGLGCAWIFDGTTGTTWETRASNAAETSMCPGFSELDPTASAGFFNLDRQLFFKYDTAGDAWTTRAVPPIDMSCWPSPARVGETLYAIKGGAVYQYAIATDTWSTPVASGLPPTVYSMSASDDSGKVYAMVSDGSGNNQFLRYDTVSSSMGSSIPGIASPTWPASGEARLGWDPKTKLMYVAPAYYQAQLWTLDPATGTLTQKTSVPLVAPYTVSAVGDIFCSDRSGHLYAQGGDGCTSPTMFQYDTATDTWTRLTDLPFTPTCEGACTVTADGWLYVSHDGKAMARLKLN
jgi:hypothetical protein